jgi:hypothetical protein
MKSSRAELFGNDGDGQNEIDARASQRLDQLLDVQVEEDAPMAEAQRSFALFPVLGLSF